MVCVKLLCGQIKADLKALLEGLIDIFPFIMLKGRKQSLRVMDIRETIGIMRCLYVSTPV